MRFLNQLTIPHLEDLEERQVQEFLSLYKDGKANEMCIAGYCDKCREMEMEVYGTVLNEKLCEQLGADYFSLHAKCCDQAECRHPFWYPRLNG